VDYLRSLLGPQVSASLLLYSKPDAVQLCQAAVNDIELVLDGLRGRRLTRPLLVKSRLSYFSDIRFVYH